MFNWIKERWEKRFAITSNRVPDWFVSPPSASGVRVTGTNCLGNPAVWRGVRLVADSVAKLPLNLYRRSEDGSRQRDESHPAYRLLKHQPSPLYSPFVFKQTLMHHALVYGNGFSWIRRTPDGQPQELLILDPEQTYCFREDGRTGYITTIDGTDYKLDWADVLCIRGLGFDGLTGYSLVDIMRDALGLGISLQTYGATYFRLGGKPSVVVELPPNIRDKEKIEEWRTTWANLQTGLDNAARPAIVQSGTKVTPISLTNDEGQYIQSRQHDLIMVADALCVPPHKIGANISSAYSSLESENKAFLQDLDCWLVNIEEECNAKLLRESEKASSSHYCEFERKALIATDATVESQILLNEVNNGLLSWEEGRQLLNRTTDRGSDTWRLPSGFTETGGQSQPPETPPEAPVTPTEPSSTEEAQRALQRLTEATIGRLVRRVERGASRAKDWDVFLSELPEAQSEVWTETLTPLLGDNTKLVTGQLLTELAEELQATGSSGRADVFRSLPERITRRVQNQD